jgi:hypothetical protein
VTVLLTAMSGLVIAFAGPVAAALG